MQLTKGSQSKWSPKTPLREAVGSLAPQQAGPENQDGVEDVLRARTGQQGKLAMATGALHWVYFGPVSCGSLDISGLRCAEKLQLRPGLLEELDMEESTQTSFRKAPGTRPATEPPPWELSQVHEAQGCMAGETVVCCAQYRVVMTLALGFAGHAHHCPLCGQGSS